MKTYLKVILVLLTLLGISSGIAKISLVPQDVQFFGAAGFNETEIILFGVAQIVAGILLGVARSRVFGAVLLGATFAFSTVLLFLSGTIGFGMFSILPILLLGFVIKTSLIHSAEETAPTSA